MKNKFVNMYLDIAERIAQESHAKRLKVGAVIANESRVFHDDDPCAATRRQLFEHLQ